MSEADDSENSLLGVQSTSSAFVYDEVNSSTVRSTRVESAEISMIRLFVTVIVLGTIILAAIIGNVFVIAAVVLERNLRNVANYLIASLAVADLMVACLVMPLAAVNELSTRWILGRELCDAWISFDVVCCTASILHLVAIALDRYWAVTQLDYIHNRSARRIVAMIVASWAVSVVISFPPLFIQNDPNYNPTTEECLISQDLGYTVFSTVGAFYLPFAVMMVIYFKVFRAARARIHKKRFRDQQRHHNNHHQQQQQQQRAEQQQLDEPVDMDTRIDAVGAVSEFSPDDGGSTVSHSPTDRQLTFPTTVTLTVFTCDDDNSAEPSVAEPSPRLATRPNQLALDQLPNRNGSLSGSMPHLKAAGQSPGGGLSPPCSPSYSACRPGNQLLLTPRKTSPAASLRGSWLDLTKQFIMDRRKETSPKSKEQRAKERMEQKRERKAARTLAVITGSFISCWLPFFIIALVRPFCRDACFYPPALMSVIGWLGYFNSLLNPVIYTVFNPDFRSAFRKILFGKYRRPRARYQYPTGATNMSLTS